jgi:parallel beta-helix repeat protein
VSGTRATHTTGPAISGAGDHPGVVVRGNVIHDNGYIGIHINGSGGTLGTNVFSDALIEDNVIYNNGQNGINADGLQNSVIRNNLIYGYQSYGICLYRIDAAGPSANNVIVNNTIVSTVSGAGAAVRILDGGTGNTVLNNILLGGGGIALRISSDSMSGLVSDYNAGGGLYQSEDTANTQALAQWQAGTGQDKHSFTATAAQLFVSPATNDYHLASTSPAIDKGTATDAPATDLDGNPRPKGAGFDIGCYEF